MQKDSLQFGSYFFTYTWQVKYIHDEFKCSHNDIKPENILLARKPASPEDVPRAMIADFGCMTTLSEAAVAGSVAIISVKF